MKFTVVFNHPYEKSFCAGILEAVVKGIKRGGHEADVINLDKDNFNPVLTEEDLKAFVNNKAVDPKSVEYIERVKKADHLVFIFPIWWGIMPALTKGFIDKVIFPGETYAYAETGFKMYSLMENVKGATVITTMNAPSFFYKLVSKSPIKNALIKSTLKQIGIKKVDWVNLAMVKASSDEKRATWLKQIEDRFADFASR